MNYSATYSPEDNKLRLYAVSRLPKDVYDRVKAAGFKWAPKQELFVAPAWTPDREDLLIEMAGEIGDEDTSLVQRAEERADRFDDYREKRGQEAERAHDAVSAIADAIPLGQPILVGHHSEGHARKDKERIENGMRKAVKLWKTSQYWKDRAAGALFHAKYKELPAVRARRIKTIAADKRKQEREKAEAEKWLRNWTSPNLTLEKARAVANYSHMPACRTEGQKYSWSSWDVLRPDEERYTGCPGWTVGQCQEKARAYYPYLIELAERWIEHCENRLAYERAMLGESGGIATDRVKPEKGGACKCWASPGHGRGWSIIQKVNRVSVTLLDNWGNGGRNFTRTMPFDKLKAVKSKAEVEAKRDAGLVTDSANGLGFFLAETPPERPATQPEPEDPASKFEALAVQLREGVKVVSAHNLFPTPPEVARRVVDLADIQPGQRVLEPSAGTGSLLEALPDTPTVAVEINGQLAEALQRRFSGLNVHHADFLSLNGELGEFDRIVMNPPFNHGSDLEHIRHAFAKLKPGGRLVAICANGPRQVDELGCISTVWEILPSGWCPGTGVRAVIVVLDN